MVHARVTGRGATAAGARAARRHAHRRPLRVAAKAVAEPTPLTNNKDERLVISQEELPDARVRCTVTVPEDVCMEAHAYVMKELAQVIKLNGFSGKRQPPTQLLINNCGKEEVQSALCERLLTTTIAEALSGVAERAIADTEMIETSREELLGNWRGDLLKPTGDITYAVLVDVQPEPVWKGEYTGMKVKVVVPTSEDDSYDRECAEAELQKKLRDMATLRVAFGKALTEGDVAILDMKAERVGETGGAAADKILEAASEGFRLDTAGGAETLPGLLGNILGMEVNESREFELEFPDTWAQETLRGVTAKFEVKLRELFLREMPDETQEGLPSQLVPGCNSMDEVRAALLEEQAEKTKGAKDQAEVDAIVAAMGECVDLAVPQALVREQGYEMYASRLLEAQMQGNLSREAMEQMTSEAMMNNYVKANTDLITRIVRNQLAVSALFKKEGMSLDPDEVEKEVEAASMQFKQAGQDYDADRVREQATDILETAKVIEFLKANNDVEYSYEPPPVTIGM